MRKVHLLLLFLPFFAAAQADSIVVSVQDDGLSGPEKPAHSPARAAWLSAVVPGAGQIYNKKYWKPPIVWGGLGLSFYFIRENTRQYNLYKDAYLAVVDDDPNTVDPFNGQYTSASLLNVAESYRRNRDFSYIAITLVYALQIIDATVDAHFFRYDVSDDLSVDLSPSFNLMAQGAAGVSLSIEL